VDRSWTVDTFDAGLRLDKYLAAPGRLASRAKAQAALGRGKVFLNGEEAAPTTASAPVAAGDVVAVWMDRPGSARPRLGVFVDGDLRVLFEDDDCIVVDKPAGLLTVPLDRRVEAPSLADLIAWHWRSRGRRQPLAVHRIDRDTSGLVVFAAHARAHAQLKSQFRRREPERVYWAIVHGRPRPPQGEWRDRLAWSEAALIQGPGRVSDPRAVEAVSRYRVIEDFGPRSLLEVRLETGKQHQIRVQAQIHGCPLVGERRYVVPDDPGTERRPPVLSRQALHARRLAFRHPADGRPLSFEAPMPDDMQQLLDELRAGRASPSRGRT
jgi:23S rRNA pseudouridine1911/1915/1917 synthase